MADLARMLQRPIGRSALAAMSLIGGSAALAACTPSGGSATAAPSASAPPASAGGSPSPAASPSAAPAANEKGSTTTTGRSTSASTTSRCSRAVRVENVVYDVYESNDVLLAKLLRAAAATTSSRPPRSTSPGWSRRYLQKLDLSRLPNLQYINPTFKNLWWDPTNEYQVPKDYGTTGILYMKSMLSKMPQSWREFYEMIEARRRVRWCSSSRPATCSSSR